MAADHLDDAHELFERAIAEPTMMMHLMRPVALMGKAELALAAGDIEQARVLHAEAALYVEQRDMYDRRPEVAYVAGMIEAAAGDHLAAVGHFETAGELLEAAGMRRRLLEVLGAKARSLEALGRMADAASEREAGDFVVAEIQSSIDDVELRSAFRQGADQLLGLTPSP